MSLVPDFEVMHEVREIVCVAQVLLTFDKHLTPRLCLNQPWLVHALILLETLIVTVEIVFVHVAGQVSAHSQRNKSWIFVFSCEIEKTNRPLWIAIENLHQISFIMIHL